MKSSVIHPRSDSRNCPRSSEWVNVESREHFLVECSSLEKVRHQFKPHFMRLLTQNNAESYVKAYLSKTENWTQLLLDSTVCGAKGGLILSDLSS